MRKSLSGRVFTLNSEEDEKPVRKLTKQEQSELLRKKVDTIGKPGQPGEQIHKVISYTYEGVLYKFYPDFLIRLKNGLHL